MITNFKIFEKKERQIWNVPLKMPDFIISLKKIGMNEKEVDKWMRLHRNKVFNHITNKERITIQYHDGHFTWYSYPSEEGNEYTDFMGKLEYTPEEIQEYYDDIKLKEDQKKYNL
jgi:hypothetical protein